MDVDEGFNDAQRKVSSYSRERMTDEERMYR